MLASETGQVGLFDFPEPVDLVASEVLVGEVSERWPPPEVQGVAQEVAGGGDLSARELFPGFRDGLHEAVRV
jgi:hypothetical protein